MAHPLPPGSTRFDVPSADRTSSDGFASPPATRSELLPTRPYAAAFARLSLAIVLAATAYAHVLWRFWDPYVSFVYRWPPAWTYQMVYSNLNGAFGMFDFDAGPVEMHLQAIWTVLTLRPVVAIFLVAGVVTVVLELRYHR